MKNSDLIFDRIYQANKFVFIALFLTYIAACIALYLKLIELDSSNIKFPLMVTAIILADVCIGFIAFAVIPSKLWLTSFFVYIAPLSFFIFDFFKKRAFDYEAELFLFIFFFVIQLISIGILRTAKYMKRKNQISNQE